MLVPYDWKDYELIDAGNGERLERWGRYILRRPDPQVIWPPLSDESVWTKTDAHYHRSKSGGGKWEFKKALPEHWKISYKDLSFYIRPTDFKHTGLFPEQAVNWDWIINKIREAARPIKMLNLFAYTGGATIAAAYAGAEVCHVDAAKGMVTWAKENAALSGLQHSSIRYIVDDVIKFIEREKRRGKTYDAVVMDPPSYGRGPKGEMWTIEDKLYELVNSCIDILSDTPLFLLINSYSLELYPSVPSNVVAQALGGKHDGHIYCGEIGLPSSSGIVLPAGIFTRWEAKQ